MFTNKRKLFIGIGSLILIIGISVFIGYSYGTSRGIPVTNAQSSLKSDFSLFWDAVDITESKYVDPAIIQNDKMLYGAIRGMVSSLDDPYSMFFEPSDAKKFDEDLAGEFGGIGAEIGTRDGIITVITPLKGNPAEKAGLLPLDRILRIDNTTTTNMSTESAVKIIRGKPGTVVKFLVYRDSWNAPKEISITRAIVKVPTLDAEVKTLANGKKVAYMHLYNFNANVPNLFYEKLLEVSKKGNPEGIILDLRNNPGGFLDVATNLGGWFFKSGSNVVSEKRRDGDEANHIASGNELLINVPVVVLVNEGSASAAEILAGALRDNRGAKLVGTKTFGKGSVQEVIDLKDGSKLKVTVAHWYTPKGTKIDKTGLEPDIKVTTSEKDLSKKKDPQLEKAMQLLQKEIK